MASWIRGGTHTLSEWEALLPSMTSASQAGILHGNNDGIPAFRWYERDLKVLRVSSKPDDAAEIIRRVSNGEGLLSNNGASICNLVSGDATRAYMTAGTLKDQAQGLGESQAFLGFFLSPSGYMRTISMFFGEMIKERIQARRTVRSGIQPQMHRGLKYAGMRAGSNVILRDVNVSLIIEEMYRGANVIYADFTDYDELAHHCGPERIESFAALDGVDAAIGTIARAAEDAPRPYRFIILSDHGQSLGATFKQRYGQSLGDVVRDLMSGRATLDRDEDQGRGLDVRELLPLRGHAQQRHRSGRGAGGARRPDDRRRRQPRRGGDSPAGRPVDDRRRRLGQPRPRVVHRARPSAHHRGARGAAPEARHDRSPTIRASAC